MSFMRYICIFLTKSSQSSVQTGALTSFTEIACLVTFSVAGYHYGHVVVVFPLSGLYATSFLANLLSRAPNTPGIIYGGGVVTGSDMTTMTTNITNLFRQNRTSNAGPSYPESTKFDEESVRDEPQDLVVNAIAPHIPNFPKPLSSV